MADELLLCLTGEVVHGRGQGGRMGFPTANLVLSEKFSHPFGVYVCRVQTEDGVSYDAIANVGVHPTVGESECVQAEVHLLDAAQNLYHARIRVFLLHFLRSEETFSDEGALIERVKRDIEEAKMYFEQKKSR